MSEPDRRLLASVEQTTGHFLLRLRERRQIESLTWKIQCESAFSQIDERSCRFLQSALAIPYDCGPSTKVPPTMLNRYDVCARIDDINHGQDDRDSMTGCRKADQPVIDTALEPYAAQWNTTVSACLIEKRPAADFCRHQQ